MLNDIRDEIERDYTIYQIWERSGPAPNLPDFDWLNVAVRKTGTQGNEWSMQRAAKRLAVSRGTLYHWLKHGLEMAPSGKLVRIADISGVEIENLLKRLGPRATNGISRPRHPPKSHARGG